MQICKYIIYLNNFGSFDESAKRLLERRVLDDSKRVLIYEKFDEHMRVIYKQEFLYAHELELSNFKCFLNSKIKAVRHISQEINSQVSFYKKSCINKDNESEIIYSENNYKNGLLIKHSSCGYDQILVEYDEYKRISNVRTLKEGDFFIDTFGEDIGKYVDYLIEYHSENKYKVRIMYLPDRNQIIEEGVLTLPQEVFKVGVFEEEVSSSKYFYQKYQIDKFGKKKFISTKIGPTANKILNEKLFNEIGNLIIEKNTDPVFSNHIVTSKYNYDSSNQLVHIECTNQHGERIQESKYRYEEDFLIEEIHYDVRKNLGRPHKIVYTYT